MAHNFPPEIKLNINIEPQLTYKNFVELVFITRKKQDIASMQQFIDCGLSIDFISRMFNFICQRNTWFLSVILVISSSAFSQNFLIMQSKESKSRDSVQGLMQIDLNQVGYSSASPYDNQGQQSVALTLGHKQKGFFFSSSEIYFAATSEKNSFVAAAPEIFMGIGNKDSNFAVAGRMKKNYSFLDSYYNLGMFNSYFTNDFISYKEQGLTGFHLQGYNGIVGVFAGWHPLYLPNQEPQVSEESGQLVSTNRWAQRPPPQFQFADKNHPIEYVIRDYRISEIISNQGYSASAFIGEDVNRPLIQVSYANHPVNEIPLMRDTYGSAMDFVGHVNLSPVVTNHQVQSADINFDFLNIQSTFSYIEDKVQNKTAAENEALQNLAPLQVYGMYVSADVSPWVRRQLIFSFAAAEMKGGEIKDLDSAGKESIFTFSSRRTQFKAPVSLGVATEVAFIKSKPLKTQVRWTYDRTDKGSLLSAKVGYELISNMNVHVGADILGVENSLPEDAASNFLDRNQANDRVYGGIQYVF